MGGSKSKPAASALPSARVVLARRQQEVNAAASGVAKAMGESVSSAAVVNESTVSAANTVVESVAAPTSASSSTPSAATPPPTFSSSTHVPERTVARARGTYDPDAPLDADILKEVSKWQVVMSPQADNKPVAPKNVVKTTTQIRLDRDGDDGDAPPTGRLTEVQLHNMLRAIRQKPLLSTALLATQYGLAEEDLNRMLEYAKCPIISNENDLSKRAY